MPEKDGDEGKSTKSVVNKKQKLGEEGYDHLRDMGKVKPSKDKKDGTTMPVSKEMKKTQKVNKGPSAFERVKAKYGKSVMDVGKKKANEELDLTQVAEAFGGYIVESTIEDRKNAAAKKLAKAAGIPIKTQGKEQAAATQAFKDMRMSGDEKFSNVTSDVKRGMRATAAGEGKAEPKKSRAPRKGVDYFFDAEKSKAERDKFIAGRKTYTDSKSGLKKGEPTEKGIVDYITKARDMRQGTNANTKANREAAKVIAKSSGKEYAQKIRDKYETDKDMSRTRGKNQPTLDQVKADIDKRNPTYTGQAGGQLPFPTRKITVKSGGDMMNDLIKKEKEKGKNIEDIEGDPRFSDIEKDAQSPQGQKAKRQIERETGTKIRPVKGERGFSGMMGRIEKAQQKSTVAATGGLLAKALNPPMAGVEAMARYQRGDKKGALISGIQSLGGPIGFAAGVVNVINTRKAVQAAASGGDGGRKGPRITSSGGEFDREGPKPTRGGASSGGGDSNTGDTLSGIGAYQIAKDTRRALKGIKDKMKLPGIRGGRAIQVSAKQ